MFSLFHFITDLVFLILVFLILKEEKNCVKYLHVLYPFAIFKAFVWILIRFFFSHKNSNQNSISILKLMRQSFY